LYNQSDSINPDADFLQKCLFLDVTQRLPELLLMRVDKVSMAHSIECRVPFLDHRIVEFAMKIPSDKKVPDKNVTKHLLKQAVKGILPDNIINRKKQGFWAPVDEWLRHDWFSFTKSTILDNKLTGSDLFNKSFITGMLENHRSGKRNEGKRLFALLTLALWHNKYFGKI
jgi:asparagine synthase (glutamine-hydrolysing)